MLVGKTLLDAILCEVYLADRLQYLSATAAGWIQDRQQCLDPMYIAGTTPFPPSLAVRSMHSSGGRS
jgi:hypothetical protein